jgi:thioredoxin-dependent peroxiredoxin
MANLTLKGNPVSTSGEIPKVGEKAKDFTLVKNDMTKTTLADFAGTKLILNIYPSIDTGTCAASTREFNKRAAGLNNTKVICISRDLPYAQKRFCGAEGIQDVMTLSDFVDGKFGKDYGLEITSGPLSHLHSRVVMVIDENGIIKYTEQVPEIVNEPNYDAALAAAQ